MCGAASLFQRTFCLETALRARPFPVGEDSPLSLLGLACGSAAAVSGPRQAAPRGNVTTRSRGVETYQTPNTREGTLTPASPRPPECIQRIRRQDLSRRRASPWITALSWEPGRQRRDVAKPLKIPLCPIVSGGPSQTSAYQTFTLSRSCEFFPFSFEISGPYPLLLG